MILCYWIQNAGANQLAKKRIKSIKLQGRENDHLSVLLWGYNNTTDHSEIISSYDVNVLW